MDAPGPIGDAAGRQIVPASSVSSICVSASCVSAISRRTSRGAARGLPRIQVLGADEQPFVSSRAFLHDEVGGHNI